jgi:ABC-type transport system involved in multi-copper enzyme maturation permease subunit
MKYLAILKDSFREAIDGKIFFVMLGLSGLLALLVVSISYEQLPADRAFGEIVQPQLMAAVIPNRGDSTKMGIFTYVTSVADVVALGPGDPPAAGDYRFRLDFRDQSMMGNVGVEVDGKEKAPKMVRAEGGVFGRGALREAVAYWLSNPGVSEVKASAVDEAQIEQFVADRLAQLGLNATSVKRLPAGESGGDRFVVEARLASPLAWPYTPALFFGALPMGIFRGPLGSVVNTIEGGLVNRFGGWAILLIAVIITAGFIPNMMRKGAVDLLLSRPIGRTELLVYKYVGGLTFILLITAMLVGLVWLAVGVRTGIWNLGFLACVPALTFYFAILYAVSTLTAVLTRNTIVAILVTCLCWFAFVFVGIAHEYLTIFRNTELPVQADGQPQKPELPDWVYDTSDALNAVTPRTSDLDTLTKRLISRDLLTPARKRDSLFGASQGLNWGEVLGVSGAYIALFLGLACWRFSTRDY